MALWYSTVSCLQTYLVDLSGSHNSSLSATLANSSSGVSTQYINKSSDRQRRDLGEQSGGRRAAGGGEGSIKVKAGGH